MAENTPVHLNRTERVIAFMVASIGGLSVVAILAVIVGNLAGIRDYSGGVWPLAVVLPAIGLPVTATLLIVFFVLRALHQRRLSRDNPSRDGGH